MTGLIADRYEIRRSIGSGGAGAVFQAWDTQLNRPVAVKRWNAPEPMLDDREGTERLWREAMTLAAIQHPNILTIHDFDVDDEGPYVITEFVDGETLDRAVEQAPFDRDAFAEAAQQILEGLIAAHQAGLIHRDLKPQNIMRTRLPSGAWQYKILDFGLAARFVTRPTVQSLEGNTSIYGSILYSARAAPPPAPGCPDGHLCVRLPVLLHAGGTQRDRRRHHSRPDHAPSRTCGQAALAGNGVRTYRPACATGS